MEYHDIGLKIKYDKKSIKKLKLKRNLSKL